MVMPETNVLRSSASPKNASPQMAGGGPYTKVSGAKPTVNVTMTNGGPLPPDQRDRNVMLSRPAEPRRVQSVPVEPSPVVAAFEEGAGDAPEAYADQEGPGYVRQGTAPVRPTLQVRMEDGQPVAVDRGAAGAKPMVNIRMDNGKPQVVTGKATPSNVKILTRPTNVGPRATAAAAAARGMGRQVTRRSFQQQLAAPIAQAAPPPLSSDQLLLARHAVDKLAKGGSLDDNNTILAQQTILAIDAALVQQQTQPVAPAPEVVAPAPQQISVGGNRAATGVAPPRRFANRPAQQRIVKAPLAVQMTEDGPVPKTIVTPAQQQTAPQAPAPEAQVVEPADVGQIGDVIDVGDVPADQ